MVTFAAGAWSVDGNKWDLTSCPSGYAPNDAADACVLCAAGTYSFKTGLKTRQSVYDRLMTCP